MTALVANAGQGRWWRSRTVRRFTSHHLALLGVAMITLLTLACVFGPHLLPYDSLYI
ncbi:MAG: peptide ABC transporter permease, partial [Mesorhizobium sp.]